jgi:hypothetical protein
MKRSTMLALLAAKGVLGGTLALGFVLSPVVPAGTARADGIETVNLSTVPPGFPTCFEEDCSDQPGQVGIWTDLDTGNAYLELGESVTLLIVDDTARFPVAHGVAAADGGVPGPIAGGVK